MWSEIAGIMAGVALFIMIGFIVKTIVDGKRRQEHLKAAMEFNNRLLDKLGSVGDFAQFLQSDGGTRLLGALSTERGAIGPRDRMLRAVHTGIILAVLGAGLLLLGWLYAFDDDAFTVIGVVSLSLGVGFLLSSAASYRLARSLGVLDESSTR